jgi:hypothetical protein
MFKKEGRITRSTRKDEFYVKRRKKNDLELRTTPDRERSGYVIET